MAMGRTLETRRFGVAGAALDHMSGSSTSTITEAMGQVRQVCGRYHCFNPTASIATQRDFQPTSIPHNPLFHANLFVVGLDAFVVTPTPRYPSLSRPE